MQNFFENTMKSTFAKVEEFKGKILMNLNTPVKMNKQRGMTMTELGVVLALGGVILAIGLAVVPSQLAKLRANKVVDALNLTIPSIQTAFQNRSSLSGLSSSVVANQGWIEKSFVDRTGGTPTLVTPWPGTIDFKPVNSNKQGQVEITDIPPTECARIIELAANSDLYVTASINGTQIKTSAVNSQVDFGTASSSCQSKPDNTITLVFAKG